MNTLPDIYKCGMLEDSLVTDLRALTDELADNWAKRQVFRTETEMRVSVLQDGKHPNKASKYWQAVREQGVFLDNLTVSGFDYRRNEVVIKRKEKALSEATDPLDSEDIQIDLDEAYFKQAAIRQTARDRVRELKLWSQIKAELDDGTFNTVDVNVHQMESLGMTLRNRRDCLTAASTQPEVINVIGPLATIDRLQAEKKAASKQAAPAQVGYAQPNMYAFSPGIKVKQKVG